MSHRKLFRLMAIMALSLTLAACASSIIGGKVNRIANFDEARLDKGQGAVLLHAVNQGSLIATRWYKLNDPDRKYSFTVYRSDRHRALDRMDDYDVVMVDPGTYVLYSVYSNCEDGLRPASTNWDDMLRPEIATALGQVSWLRSWKPGSSGSTGVGIWGGSGSGPGVGVGVDVFSNAGVGTGPGSPIATCNLLSSGMSQGRPSLATVTVKAGEVVYAGELDISYSPTRRCENSGNWMTDNETRQYCGADWMTLRITDRYSSHARPFIEKALGPVAAQKAVVRLAEPGSLVSVK